MEKAYKTMSQAGAGSIVIGIITIVTGVTAGIIAIVNDSDRQLFLFRLRFAAVFSSKRLNESYRTDENTIILCIELTDGRLFSHGTMYEF